MVLISLVVSHSVGFPICLVFYGRYFSKVCRLCWRVACLFHYGVVLFNGTCSLGFFRVSRGISLSGSPFMCPKNIIYLFLLPTLMSANLSVV